jgi:probable HAF family extracellular repeat protein
VNRTTPAVCALALLVSTAAAQSWDFRPMPDLPGGAFMSRANYLTPGRMVVGVSTGASGDEAVGWNTDTGALTALGDLPGGPFASEAFACSSDGLTIFGYGTNAQGNQEAFRWTPSTGMAPLGFLEGGSISRAYACSSDGSAACGECVTQSGTQAFRWTAAGMQPLGFLPGGTFSTARSMSWNGEVIVGWALDAGGVSRPFRWTATTGMVDISGGGFPGQARGVSGDGDALVGVNQADGQAFLWKLNAGFGPGFTDLPALPGAPGSEPNFITVVYDRIVGSSGGRACTWINSCGWAWYVRETVYAPPSPGWTIVSSQAAAYSIFTVGNGINPAGQPQGWIATDPGLGPQCCCGADFDCDGDVGTDFDIQAFFACLAGVCPSPPCPYNADFNGDGDVGTDADIEAFIRVLVGSCC